MFCNVSVNGFPASGRCYPVGGLLRPQDLISQTMAAATISMYSSEYEVVLENAKSSGNSSYLWSAEGSKGSLYGLWTHSGNVIVHLAIPAMDPKEASWKAFCREHRLQRLGSWGTGEPRASDRPSPLEASVGYVYIRCVSGSSTPLTCYSLAAPMPGSYSHGQAPPQSTEMTVLPTPSPYRLMKDPTGTRRLTASDRRTDPSPKQSSIAGHWSERPEHFGFLKELKECFSRRNLVVKQFYEVDSNILAFQIKEEETAFGCAIGFPPDFHRERNVQIYGGEGGPVEVTLPARATEAFDVLFQRIARKHTKPRERTNTGTNTRIF